MVLGITLEAQRLRREDRRRSTIDRRWLGRVMTLAVLDLLRAGTAVSGALVDGKPAGHRCDRNPVTFCIQPPYGTLMDNHGPNLSLVTSSTGGTRIVGRGSRGEAMFDVGLVRTTARLALSSSLYHISDLGLCVHLLGFEVTVDLWLMLRGCLRIA